MKKQAKPRQQKQKKKQQRATPAHLTLTKPIGFPDSYSTVLRYADTIVINPGATIGQYTFRGNSLFDPDYTGTGHQPMYFDQLAAIYGKYRVYSCTFHVSVATAATVAAQVVIIPNSDVLAFATPYAALEHPRASVLPIVGVSGIQTQSRSYKMTTRQILGLTNTQMQDADYSALVSANPVQIWYFILHASEPGGGNVHTVNTVTLDFECEFFDRADVAAS